MAVTDLQAIQIANDQGFQRRCQDAMEKAAIAVKAEANTVAGHALRETYADKVIGQTANVFAIALAIMTNATILAEADVTQTSNSGFAIPDSDIDFTCTSVFNALAGVQN